VDSTVSESNCELQNRVANRIGGSRYETWFRNHVQFELTPDCLEVIASNAFVANWIAAHYLNDLAAAARDATGRPVRVRVRISTPADGTASRHTAPERRQPADREPGRNGRSANRFALAPRRADFRSFVVGPCNNLAYSAACQMARNPGATFKLLVLHGGCGLGKTHLLQAICTDVAHERPGLDCRYISGEEFTNEYIAAVKTGRIEQFRAHFRSVDLLVIDDIHFLANKKATQEEFLHTFDAIDAGGKAVVLSSDAHPRSIASLSEPLIDRLIAGMIVHIQPPDFPTRRGILARRAEAMAQSIPDDVLDLVARRVTRNVRELEGALYKLVALASLMRQPITLDLAVRALDDHLGSLAPPASADIEHVVSAYFEVSPQQMRSDSRERSVSLARAVAMYLIRKHTTMSFPEIGRLMGNKNHSTALMAVQRIEKVTRSSGAVSWKDVRGPREAPIRDVLMELETRLAERPR
jgi:chromosomal replication initiator protein